MEQVKTTEAETAPVTPDVSAEAEAKAAADKEKQAVLDEVEKNYWKNTGRNLLKDWRLYVMLIPMLAVFFLWRYLPLYQLLTAFKVDDQPIRSVWDRDFVGLHWFMDITTGKDYKVEFWQAFRNTFLLSFYGLLYGFPVPIILAIFFNEIKNDVVRSGFQVITYLPRFVSTVVITTIISLLLMQRTSYSEAGVLSRMLAAIFPSMKDPLESLNNSSELDTGLLRIPKYFRAIYQISGIWEQAGYGSIVFFAAIIMISPTNYEAAQMDGATKMQQFRYVVLPGMASTIVVMLVLRIGELLNMGYEKVLLLYNQRIYSTADIISTFVARYGGVGSASGGSGLESMPAAADLMAALLSMFLVIGSNKVAKKVSDTSLY